MSQISDNLLLSRWLRDREKCRFWGETMHERKMKNKRKKKVK